MGTVVGKASNTTVDHSVADPYTQQHDELVCPAAQFVVHARHSPRGARELKVLLYNACAEHAAASGQSSVVLTHSNLVSKCSLLSLLRESCNQKGAPACIRSSLQGWRAVKPAGVVVSCCRHHKTVRMPIHSLQDK